MQLAKTKIIMDAQKKIRIDQRRPHLSHERRDSIFYLLNGNEMISISVDLIININ